MFAHVSLITETGGFTTQLQAQNGTFTYTRRRRRRRRRRQQRLFGQYCPIMWVHLCKIRFLYQICILYNQQDASYTVLLFSVLYM
jgi:hypothetical protein